MKNCHVPLSIICFIFGISLISGCGNGGNSSSSLSAAKASVESGTSSLYPVAGQFIDSTLAKKYIRQFSGTLNSKDDLTKFVVFRTDSLIKALNGYSKNKGEYVRIYLGVDSVDYEFGGEQYNRLTVFFQPAKEAIDHQLEDLRFDSRNQGTQPYNLGLICPPPKCVGRSNFYPSL